MCGHGRNRVCSCLSTPFCFPSHTRALKGWWFTGVLPRRYRRAPPSATPGRSSRGDRSGRHPHVSACSGRDGGRRMSAVRLTVTYSPGFQQEDQQGHRRHPRSFASHGEQAPGAGVRQTRRGEPRLGRHQGDAPAARPGLSPAPTCDLQRTSAASSPFVHRSTFDSRKSPADCSAGVGIVRRMLGVGIVAKRFSRVI